MPNEGKAIKVLLATPAFTGFLHTLVIDSMWNAYYYALANSKGLVIDRLYMHRNMVDRARQQAHETALEKGYDYIMWWDDDILAPRETILRLLSHQKDIVSALLCRRTWPFNIYAYRQTNGHALEDFDSYQSITAKEAEKGELLEIGTTGTGCTLVKVDLVKDMPKPWWEWPKTAAEDVNFCVKAKKLGAKVFVDSGIRTVHLDFQPQFVDYNKHVATVEQLKQAAKDRPEITKDPEWSKLGYMLDA